MADSKTRKSIKESVKGFFGIKPKVGKRYTPNQVAKSPTHIGARIQTIKDRNRKLKKQLDEAGNI